MKFIIFCAGLFINVTLRGLDLTDNPIGKVGAKALSDAMALNLGLAKYDGPGQLPDMATRTKNREARQKLGVLLSPNYCFSTFAM